MCHGIPDSRALEEGDIINIDITNTTARRKPDPRQTNILALGTSKAQGGNRPLPHVPAELDAIVQEADQTDPIGIYPGKSYLDEQFTRRALNRLYGRDILHIATHGSFNPTTATGTYLLLGDGEKFPITDIETLSDLGDIHLAVLSACETALTGNPNRENSAEGREISSLVYYFTAGSRAKAVLATLWKVNDGYTRIFMEEFYKVLAENPDLTKAEALRETQLTFIRGDAKKTGDTPANGTHPYHWAPFTLTGNSW